MIKQNEWKFFNVNNGKHDHNTLLKYVMIIPLSFNVHNQKKNENQCFSLQLDMKSFIYFYLS